MAKLNSLHDLFVDQLKVLFYSEKEIKNTLSEVIKKATSDELKDALENHFDETTSQIERLEKVFKFLEVSSVAKRCIAMDGIIDEINEIINENASPLVKDAAIIAEIQKALHFKIACYGTLKTYARLLGHDEIVDLMQETVKEEKSSDKHFTEIAEGINQEAVSG
jgi:ferritin-like metal-binding protein YciE